MSDRIETLMRTIADADMTCDLNISTWKGLDRIHVQFIAKVWVPIPSGARESPYMARSQGDSPYKALTDAFRDARDWMVKQP